MKRLTPIVVLCVVCVLACTKGMNPSSSMSGPGGVSKSGSTTPLGPAGTSDGGTAGDTGTGYGGSSGVGAGFGGQDPERDRADLQREVLVTALKNLLNEPNLSFLGTGLGLTVPQATLVNELIVSSIPQLIELHTRDPKVEIRIADTLPGNVSGRTEIGPDGIIELLRSAVKAMTSSQLLALVTHESFHKVLFRGKYLDDLSSLDAFAFSGGSGVAINKAADGIRLYATSQIYAAKVLSRKPTVYARLNETSGTRATDVSGRNHHGQYLGGIQYGVSGAVDGGEDTAITFVPGGKGHIKFILNQVDGGYMSADGFTTVEFWLRGNMGFNGDEINRWTPNIALHTGGVVFGGGPTGFGFLNMAGLSFYYGMAGAALPILPGWNHFVVVMTNYDPYNQKSSKIYWNGHPVNYTEMSGTHQAPGSEFTFGDWYEMGVTFNGSMDEIAIYLGELPPAFVQEHYELGIRRNP